MGQAREHGRLAREILDGFFLGDSVAQDHFLDGDGTIGEAGIIGQVDPAHAAHAENLPYSVSIVEEMALGKRLTRIHSASSIPGHDSADRASRRAASHAGSVQGIGSTVSFKNVLPIMISSPVLSSTGVPGCKRAPRFT